ncbi:MAG: glycosyltransferase family 4 protein [bacterium]
MNILHINNYDTIGGATKSCMSIHNALKEEGYNSELLTQTKLSKAKEIYEFSDTTTKKISRFVRMGFDMAAIKLLTIADRGRFSFPYLGADISKHHKVLEADIINLHWVNGGFFSISTLQKLKELNKPIVWTFHDMWAFTGGCHYTGGCLNYITECTNCPCLKKTGIHDYSNKIFLNKIKLFKDFNIHIIACSNWLANETKRSALLNNKAINMIPQPIDINTYNSFDKIESRRLLNLDPNKKYILFGTMTLSDKRKGLLHLIRSLKKLGNFYANQKDNIEVLVFGSANKNELIDIPFKTTSLGRISDTNFLAKIYSAADVFIAPSLEDNLPNTVMESLSCGTPVAAFNIGGMCDMIDHKSNGYLAAPESIDDLTDGILWILNDKDRLVELSKNARKKIVANFTNKIVARQYVNLYNNILNNF